MKLIQIISVFSVLYISDLQAQSNSISQDSLQMQEIIIQENRMQIPFAKTGRDVQIITQKQIMNSPAQSINELLTYTLGVDVRQRGPIGAQADVSIDGGTFEQTLILLNGVKMSDAQTAHHSMQIPVPLEAIERIEILKGPAARIYGIQALTGAINIVTKKNMPTSASVSTYGGSSFIDKDKREGSGVYSGAGLGVTATIAKETQQHLIAASLQTSNGHRYNTSVDQMRLYYEGHLQLAPQNQLQWMLGHQKNDFGANGCYAAPNDVEARELVTTTIASIGYQTNLGDRWLLKPRISVRYNEDDYRYYRYDISRARSQHYSNAIIGELNSSYNTSWTTLGFGYEFRYDGLESSNMGSRERQNHGWYAEMKPYLSERWNLQLGTYINYSTHLGWNAYPGLDVAYQCNDYWKIGFNMGSSQRIPSFTDLYLQQLPGNKGNPNLLSENAWQYEVSIAFEKNNKNFKTGIFRRDIKDFIDWTRTSMDTPYQPDNYGNKSLNGFHIRWSHQININSKMKFQYQTGYQYLHPENINYTDDLTSKYVLESLRHQLITSLHFGISNYGIQVNNRWVEREMQHSYSISDVKLLHKKAKYQIYLQISNLENKQYIEVAATPMPGRWYTMGITYSLY